jgi:hypothetical protein
MKILVFANASQNDQRRDNLLSVSASFAIRSLELKLITQAADEIRDWNPKKALLN